MMTTGRGPAFASSISVRRADTRFDETVHGVSTDHRFQSARSKVIWRRPPDRRGARAASPYVDGTAKV